MSFDDYLEANADSEEEMLRQAVAAAEAKDAEARGQLRNVEKQGAAGELTDITQAASYGDYLDAKRGSKEAWAKLMQSSDPRQRAVLQTLGARMGIGAKADAAEAAWGGREDAVTGNLKSLSDSRAQWAALAEKKRLAEEERAKVDKDNRDAYVTSLIQGTMGRAAAGGAQLDFVGSKNRYASSPWASETGGLEVARARAAGASDEQLRDIWNAYTGKGHMGSPRAQPGGDATMRGSESEWDKWFKR